MCNRCKKGAKFKKIDFFQEQALHLSKKKEYTRCETTIPKHIGEE